MKKKVNESIDFHAKLRVFHGGYFKTVKHKTEYVNPGNGGMLMKVDMVDEVCYFNLLDIIKTDLGYKEQGEMWFKRKGLSLFAGRKKIMSDKDVELLMETKDVNGFVTVYVVHGREKGEVGPENKKKRKESEVGSTSTSTNPINKQVNTTRRPKLPFIRTKNPNPETPFLNPKNLSKEPVNRRPLNIIERPQFCEPHELTEALTVQGGEADLRVEVDGEIGGSKCDGSEEAEVAKEGAEEGADEDSDGTDFDEDGAEDRVDDDEDVSDPDVVISEGDFDDESDDDLFAEHVVEEADDFNDVNLGLRGIEFDVGGKGGDDDQSSDTDAELPSDDDELNSQHGSDDEVDTYPVFNPATDFNKKIELSLGLKFPTVVVCRKALRYHAVDNGYEYYYLHNSSKRVSAYCKKRCNCKWISGKAKLGKCLCSKGTKKCNFKFHAKKLKGQETFQIRSLSLGHICSWSNRNNKCTSVYLAERYLDYWRLDSTTTVETFQKKVLGDLGVEVKYYKAYYAKEKALKMIYGEANEQYRRVWDYAETVKKYNVGSSVFVQLDNIENPPPLFKRMYMCLDACKKGFIGGCRPIMGVDGCHLKGPFPGQLLTAVSKDGNCNIFPVAWAIVEVENKDSWTWFLELLMKDIEPVADNITFMSDRQKGLLEAFSTVVPNAEIRFCCRHIWSNFKLTYPGEAYKQLFWKIARAFTKAEFEVHMEEMKAMSVGAHRYLNAIPTKHWCRHAYSNKCKSAMMLNNCCESFNNALRKCRDKPVLSVMEWIRRYCMKRIFRKWEGVEKEEGRVMPAIVKQLKISEKEIRRCELIQSGVFDFEVVMTNSNERYIVNLESKECSCYKWTLTGVPCTHAYACIQKKRFDIEDFVHEAYTPTMYKKAYQHHLKPLPGAAQWERSACVQPLPPPFKKQPGRPSNKKRKKETGESDPKKGVKRTGTKKTCSNCGKTGHNKKGCKAPTQAQAQTQTQAQVPQRRRKRQRTGAAEEVSMSGPSRSSQHCATQSSQASSNNPVNNLAMIVYQPQME